MLGWSRPRLALDAGPVAEAVTDRELLLRFHRGDQAAFSELVQRHAELVMGVCRRVLHRTGDAEDAFQATFLVLAVKARAFSWQDSIAGWLYQTARRTALKLRSGTARRQAVESAAARERPETVGTADAAPATAVAMRELAEVLDEELGRLPAHLREVLLLAQLEGLSREEVARRLGISLAAVKDRLERGREQLRQRLVRRGITLTATTIAAWLLPGTAQAGQAVLVSTTTQVATAFTTGAVSGGSVPTAVALAQGVLKMMAWEKCTSLVICLASIFTAGTIAYGMLQDDPQRFDKGLRGEVVAVALNGKAPNVTVKLDGEVLLNLDVDPQAKVWTAFEPGRLEDLRTERMVSLRLGTDHRTVTEIHMLGAQREVTLKSIEPSGRITAIEGEDEEDDEGQRPPVQEFQLAPNAIVRINGLPATKDDLKPGMRIPLEFSNDGKKVNAVETDGDQALVRNGQIVAVLSAENQLKVRVWGDDLPDEGAEMTYAIAPNSILLLDGKPAKLADLPPRGEINLRLDESQQVIRALKASTPEPEEPEMNAQDEGDCDDQGNGDDDDQGSDESDAAVPGAVNEQHAVAGR